MFKYGITSYSYQDEILLGRMTWEDVLAHAASIGARGFEIVPEQFLTGLEYETLPPDFVARWKDLVAKYDLEPTNCNIYDDFDVYPNRMLRDEERFERAQHGIRVAKALGFKSVRGCPDFSQPLLEQILREAEDNGVILSFEIHAPFSLKSDWLDNWLNTIERTGTKYGGIHPDAAIFSRGPHYGDVQRALRHGTKPEVIEYLTEAYAKTAARRAAERETIHLGDYRSAVGYGIPEITEGVLKLGGTMEDVSMVARLACDDPAWMVEYAKYIVHFHAKFYDMVPDGHGGWYDPSIDYEGIVKALLEADYQGYISSEYEGFMPYHDWSCPEDTPPVDDMITKQHAMLRSYVEKYTK